MPLPERRKKVQLIPGGPPVDATEVAVDEASEKWSEYKLSDGTTLRFKQVLIEISRVDGQYDQAGNPVYVMKAQPVMAIVDVPETLKKKTLVNQ